MVDHEPKIPKILYLPPHVWEVEPSITYGTPVGLGHSMAQTSPDDPSQFPRYMHANRRYWSCIPNYENQHAPTRASTIRYGMPHLPETGPVPNVRSGFDPGVAPGGTSIPFQVERFGSTSHITPSILAVEDSSHMNPSPSTTIPVQGLIRDM